MFKDPLIRWRNYLLVLIVVAMLVLAWYVVYQRYQLLSIVAAMDEPGTKLKEAQATTYLALALAILGTAAGAAVILTTFLSHRQAARATEERQLLLQAIEQAAQTVVITDANGTILYANPAFERITGYSVTEVLGQNPRLLKSDQHPPGFYRDLWKAISGGQVWHGQFINRRKDGVLYHEEATITPIRDAGGKVTRYIAIKQDISSQVQAQKEIGRHARLSQTLLNIFADLGTELDPDVLYQRLVEQIVAILPDADSGSLLIKENAHFTFRGAVGHDLAILRHIRFLPGQLLAADAGPGQVIRSNDIAHHDRHRLDAEQLDLLAKGAADFASIICAPIHIEGQFIGTLSAESSDNPNAFGDLDEETLRLFAAQAGVVIRNAQLHDAEHRQRRQAEVLVEISRILSTSLELTDVLDQTLDQLKRVIDYDSASIILFDDERLHIVSCRGFPEEVILQALSINLAISANSLAQCLLTTGQPIFIPDTLNDERFDHTWVGSKDTRSWLGVPLTFGKRVIGYLTTDRRTPSNITPAEIELAEAVARQATIAIMNARLFRDTARQVGELHALADASRIISSVLDPDRLLEALYQQIVRIAPADFYAIALYDEASNIVSIEVNVDEGVRYPRDRYTLDKGLLQWVIHNRQPLRFNSLVEEEAKLTQLDIEAVSVGSLKPNHGWLGVPMLYGDRVVGAIVVGSYQRGTFDENHQRTLMSIANQAAVALENARLVAQLRQSETLHRSVVEAAARMDICVGIFQNVGDREGVIIFANEAVARLVGYPLQEILGKTLTEFVHPDSLTLVTERYRARQRGEALPHCYEFFARHRSGKKILVEMSVTALEYQEQPATIAIFSDVTQQRALEAQLRQSQKLEAIGTLAGGIAHDFNNLLTGILGNLQLAQMELPPDTQTVEDLQSAERSAQRAANLTRQLLTFSRKSQVVQTTSGNLGEVLDDVVSLLRHTIDRRIEINVHSAHDLWAAKIDANQMTQLLINLSLNARDALMERLTTNCSQPTTDFGEAKLTIEVTNVTIDQAYCQSQPEAWPGEFICLSISDTGCGMNADVQSRIFEPFFTTKEVGQGTGLGLAQVYGIVKAHEGFINFHSEPGVGTVFRVYLPRALEAKAAPASQGQGGLLDLPTGAETILLVDDEASVRKLGQRLLERQGYRVLLAHDGPTSLDIYRRERAQISLVILDLTMPRLSGREVLQELLALNPAAKVILSSGYSAEEQSHDLLAAGAVAFVPKPYTLRSLAETVRRVLDEE